MAEPTAGYVPHSWHCGVCGGNHPTQTCRAQTLRLTTTARPGLSVPLQQASVTTSSHRDDEARDLHRSMCVSVPSRDCRHGGTGACRRCPYLIPLRERERDWCRKGLHLWMGEGGLVCGRANCTARRATATYGDHTVISGGLGDEARER